MENKRNFQRELEQLIEKECADGRRPVVMLHSCCGPCSSYVLEYLTQYFDILLYFYNPNIHPDAEYQKRLEAQKLVLSSMNFGDKVKLIEGKYNTDEFFEAVKGLENEPEGGARCEKCIDLRIRKTAQIAESYKTDFFATTLTVSPHKNAIYINKTGAETESDFSVKYLVSDFKKKNGYKRSIELCREHGIYRQNYCGCVYSIWDDGRL